MAWPAPDLPVNFGNATVSLDTHPQAHNDTNESLNNNFRPELTRVGNSLAGTQSVFQGTNPDGTAAIETGTGLAIDVGTSASVNLYRNGAAVGIIPSLRSQYFAQNTAPVFTAGPTMVAASRVTIPLTFPAGGFMLVTVHVVAERNTADGYVYNAVGRNYDGNDVYAGSTTWAGATISTTTGRHWLNTTTGLDIPPGTVNPSAICGIADSTIPGGASILSSAVTAVVWSY